MLCRITDLRCKDIINLRDGSRLGVVCDVEVDTCTGKIIALIVFGRYRFFGLLGREDDIIIRWCDIQVIGEDTILVNFECEPKRRKKNSFLDSFFK